MNYIKNINIQAKKKLYEKLLKEKYRVFRDALKSNRFTTTFLKGESLEQVLTSICEFNGAVYQYDKEKATVSISNSKNK